MRKIYLVMQADRNSNSTGGVPVRAFSVERSADKCASDLNAQYEQAYYSVHSVNLCGRSVLRKEPK